jgi:hypothetical protein
MISRILNQVTWPGSPQIAGSWVAGTGSWMAGAAGLEPGPSRPPCRPAGSPAPWPASMRPGPRSRLPFDGHVQQGRPRAGVAEVDFPAGGLVGTGPSGDGDGAGIVGRLLDAVRRYLARPQNQCHVEQ